MYLLPFKVTYHGDTVETIYRKVGITYTEPHPDFLPRRWHPSNQVPLYILHGSVMVTVIINNYNYK